MLGGGGGHLEGRHELTHSAMQRGNLSTTHNQQPVRQLVGQRATYRASDASNSSCNCQTREPPATKHKAHPTPRRVIALRQTGNPEAGALKRRSDCDSLR